MKNVLNISMMQQENLIKNLIIQIYSVLGGVYDSDSYGYKVGQPEDYISNSTGIEYREFNKMTPILKEFMTSFKYD